MIWLRKEFLSLRTYQQKPPKAEKEIEELKQKQNRISKGCGTNAKDVTYAQLGKPEGEETEKGTQEIPGTIAELPQINARGQATDPGSPENTEQDKYFKNYTTHIIFKLQKIKDKEKS